MKKKYFGLIAIIFLLTLTGCFKEDTLENVTVYTTNYAIEYITNQLYGSSASVTSIYPNDVDINKYKLTDKQLTDDSKGSIFIYNGLSNEKNYAISMLNKNKKLLIIDASMSMEYTNKIEDIWLDPSNFLMMAQNIRTGFKEYITSTYLKRIIDSNYEKLKISVSEIDAELNLIASNANDKNIVVADDLLLFLSKYGLNVISLEKNDNLTAKIISDAEKLISSGKIKYIFIKDNDTVNSTVKMLIDKYHIETISFKTGSNLSDQERIDKIDFLNIMDENINSLKKELYQ